MKTITALRPKIQSALVVSLIFGLLAGTGCRSSKQPASASFASVVIPNHSVEEIQRTTAAVFQEADYRPVVIHADEMVFDKEGTRGQQFAHGGWATDSAVAVRVRAEIVPLPNGSHRLQCKAYMVRDAGDLRYEEEKRVANFRSRPYQKLLDEVAERLK